MLTKDFAEHFASEWIRSWNCHDLELILSHYADDFVMSSPLIALVAGEPSGTLQGKAAIGAYWKKALSQIANLNFQLECTLVGVDSVVIYYKGVRGMAAEAFFFDSSRKVVKSCAHYA